MQAFCSVFLLLLLIGSSIWRKQLRIKYEHWNVAHGLFSLIVIFAALVHMFILGRYTSTPGHENSVGALWRARALPHSVVQSHQTHLLLESQMGGD